MKTAITKIVISFLFALFISACASLSLDTQATNYEVLISKLVSKSSKKIEKTITAKDILLVSDFVNLEKLENRSKLGFILSNMLKNELSSKYNITIKEVELAKHFKIGSQGFKILSRRSQEIDNNIGSSEYVLVGTYSITPKQLILFIKLVDIYNGNILTSSTIRTKTTNEIIQLESTNKKRRIIYNPLVL